REEDVARLELPALLRAGRLRHDEAARRRDHARDLAHLQRLDRLVRVRAEAVLPVAAVVAALLGERVLAPLVRERREVRAALQVRERLLRALLRVLLDRGLLLLVIRLGVEVRAPDLRRAEDDPPLAPLAARAVARV